MVMYSVYCSYNRSEDKIYAGYEPGDSLYSCYMGTTDDRDFNVAKQYGKLEKHTLMQFDTELEARTAEAFAIKYFKTHGIDSYNRNEGGGGKDGTVTDFRLITKEFRNVVERIVIDRSFPEKFSNSSRELVDSILESIKENEIETVLVPLTEIDSYEKFQVRVKHIDNGHVERLVDLMHENPAKFRKNTDPLVIVVDDRETPYVNYLIGGNHRTSAAKKANWLDFPVVFVNYSLLGYQKGNMKLLGEHDNLKNDIIEKEMDNEDLRYIIQTFHEENPNLDPNDEEFNRLFKSLYLGGRFTANQIGSNLKAYRDRYNKEELSAASNFHSYGPKELENIETYISCEEQFSDAIFIREEMKRLENYAVGAILNKFRQEKKTSSRNRRNFKNVGVVIARFNHPADVVRSDDFLESFDGTLAEAGYVQTKNAGVWKNKNNDQIIKLIILPYRHESNKSVTSWSSFKKCLMIENDRTSKAA